MATRGRTTSRGGRPLRKSPATPARSSFWSRELLDPGPGSLAEIELQPLRDTWTPRSRPSTRRPGPGRSCMPGRSGMGEATSGSSAGSGRALLRADGSYKTTGWGGRSSAFRGLGHRPECGARPRLAGASGYSRANWCATHVASTAIERIASNVVGTGSSRSSPTRPSRPCSPAGRTRVGRRRDFSTSTDSRTLSFAASRPPAKAFGAIATGFRSTASSCPTRSN